jgi:gliding motility-associated lipoprotein GldH
MSIETTKHNHRAITLIALLIAASAAVSCIDGSIAWQQTAMIKDCIWNKDSILMFNIPAEDTLAWYSFSIDVRNRTDYSFQNLYIFLNVKAPNGNSIVDTLNFALAYDNGEWTGKGGMFSKYRENSFLYRNYIRFPARGTYSVNIRHGMRKDSLEGISAVGLSLNYSKN